MKTARIFLVLLIAAAASIAFMSEKTAFADSPPNFKTFPTLGVSKGSSPFGKVRIGDSVEKLEHNFGMPLEKYASEITFNTKNNKVSGMYYTLYYEVPE